MFENLLSLIQQNAGDAIVNNPAIPNEHNNTAISMASGSIIDGLKGVISNGNISDIMQLFSQGSNAGKSAITQNIQSGFIENLVGNQGIDKSQAGNIAASLIPTVINQFVHKTNDPNDSSFNLQDILGNLTKGAGNLDVSNLLNQFSGNSNSTQTGGLMDNIKGLFN